MNEKKVLKLGITGVLLIIAIIVIAIMGMFICKLSKEKADVELKASELQSRVNSLNATVSDLQNKLNIIAETINSALNTNNNNEQSTSSNVQTAIIGRWRADKVLDSNGKDLGLNAAFGSGINYSNEMEFKENGILKYGISITASSDDGEYSVNGQTINCGIPTDTKGVLDWHTFTYNSSNDTLEEQKLNGMEQTVIYTRIK